MAVVVLPSTVCAMPPGEVRTVYDVIALVPGLAGAVQVMVACASPLDATTLVGASGRSGEVGPLPSLPAMSAVMSPPSVTVAVARLLLTSACALPNATTEPPTSAATLMLTVPLTESGRCSPMVTGSVSAFIGVVCVLVVGWSTVTASASRPVAEPCTVSAMQVPERPAHGSLESQPTAASARMTSKVRISTPARRRWSGGCRGRHRA